MNLIKQTIIACAFAFATSNVASAAILDIATDGTLMGASGVDVGGTLYDVTFGDGVIGDSLSPFTTLGQATAASNALLSQVLIGDYDTLSKNTNGCTSTALCNIYTSYGLVPNDIFSVNTVVAVNIRATRDSTIPSTDRIAPSSIPLTLTTIGTAGSSIGSTIAFWSVSATAVPEPETYAMFLAGLGLLGFVARRRK